MLEKETKTHVVTISTETNDLPKMSTTLWFTGCKILCKGCHNSSLNEFQFGYTYKEIEKELEERLELTNWLVYLGGNPIDSVEEVLMISEIAKKLKYKQFLYTGYSYDEFTTLFDENKYKFLDKLDYIKTGKYDETLRKEMFNCSSYFFETLNQEVYESSGNGWQRVYGYDFNERKVFGEFSIK